LRCVAATGVSAAFNAKVRRAVFRLALFQVPCAVTDGAKGNGLFMQGRAAGPIFGYADRGAADGHCAESCKPRGQWQRKDGRSLLVDLRKDVLFSRPGQPLTARDILQPSAGVGCVG